MPLFRIMGGSQRDGDANERRSSRFTYPGQRAAPLPPVASHNNANNSRNGAPQQANPIVRGSNVGGAANRRSGPPGITPSPGNPVPAQNSSATSTVAGASSSNSDINSSSTGSQNRTITRPGAYQVTRSQNGPAQVYRVIVPANTGPGQNFIVNAGSRRVEVRCPPTSRPGQSLQITLPPQATVHHHQLRAAKITAAEGEGSGGAITMSPEVRRVNEQAYASGGTAQTFLIKIPANVFPGMQFNVNVNGQRFMVTCPPNAGPNMTVRIVPPAQREEPEAAPKTQVFEVKVPKGIKGGQPFALVANGQRVLVTCPPTVQAGQTIRFQLPVSQVVGGIKLSYESEKGGWTRTIRATDLKFQWVRLDGKSKSLRSLSSVNGDADTIKSLGEGTAVDGEPEQHTNVDLDGMNKFDFQRSAYVRKITYMEGNDARMRCGTIELVPANEAVVDSKVVVHNRTLLSYADIAATQGKSLDEKTTWFQNICSQLSGAWEDGHVKIVVRRRALLTDAVEAIMALGRDDLRKRWRVEFLGEPGIDAGGVTREFFELVTEHIFDPAAGLFVPSFNNQACVQINPSSGVSCPDDHLIYFRFLGRILGRALFDRQLIKGHTVRTIYKHLLGWPITFEDLMNEDEEYYNSLKKLNDMEDIECMYLDFTTTEDRMGVRTDVELVKGGKMKDVTNENLAEYLEANLKYRLIGRIKKQLTEVLLGFFDVVPEPALTVFDSSELELILCGLPTIDMEDWKANTNYTGLFDVQRKSHQVVGWFWEVATEDFDQEMRARLLQFVTGSSGVPTRGFSVLQGVDGNIKLFTIHGVDAEVYKYPRAHTCFNRIDLPTFSSRKELYERLRTAVTMSAVGFGIE